MYEVEYLSRVNKEKQQIELVKWSGEDQVIMKIGYDYEKTGFRFKEAKAFIEKYKCLLEEAFFLNPNDIIKVKCEAQEVVKYLKKKVR